VPCDSEDIMNEIKGWIAYRVRQPFRMCPVAIIDVDGDPAKAFVLYQPSFARKKYMPDVVTGNENALWWAAPLVSLWAACVIGYVIHLMR
jgi:hypothetical protein